MDNSINSINVVSLPDVDSKLSQFAATKTTIKSFMDILAGLVSDFADSDKTTITIKGKTVDKDNLAAGMMLSIYSDEIQNASSTLIKSIEDRVSLEKRINDMM